MVTGTGGRRHTVTDAPLPQRAFMQLYLPKLHSRCAASSAFRLQHSNKGELAMSSNTWKRARLGVIMAATAAVGLPVAGHAQDTPLGYPVVGPYVGLSGGLNLKGSESIKNLSRNFNPGLTTGLSTPNLNFSTDLGSAGIAGFGWGFGNGLRAEVEFDYRANGISKLSGTTPAGFGESTRAGGTEQLWGPM